MSNYIEPKMDWKPESVPTAADFNRIEGDVDYLQKAKVDKTTLAAPNGVATLDANGIVVQKAVTVSSLTFTGGVSESFNGSTAKSIAIPTVLPSQYDLTIGSKRFNGSAPVTIVKSDLGLGNADNTSDLNKPVSSAQQAALNGKVDKVSGKQLSTEDFTTAEKNKLNGVAASANNYVHPATHPASVIVQDSNNRFMTDTERNKLNGITVGANNYVHPATHPASVIVQDSNNRFMTDAERNKLAGLSTASVNGVKGSSESTYRTGNVNITAANVGALALSGGGTITNGSIRVSNGSVSAQSFTATSDRRLKSDISYVKEDLSNKLLQLDVKTYRFKNDSTDNFHIGVIAQDLEKILGSDASLIVADGNEGYKSIDANGIFFLMLDLLKKQEKRITFLEKVINQKGE